MTCYPRGVNVMTPFAYYESLWGGEPLTPLLPGTKRRAFKATTQLTRERILELLRNDYNLGFELAKRKVCVVDTDTPQAEQWAKAHGFLPGKQVVETSRGIHIWTRHTLEHPTNLLNHEGLGVDVLFNATVLLPPSWVADTEHRRKWLAGPVPIDELPLFPSELYPERKKLPAIAGVIGPTRESLSRIACPEAYCMRIPSVQGSWGSKALVKVVCVLRDAGRTSAECYEFLVTKWNPVCAEPPWSEREIVHAIRRHYGMKVGSPGTELEFAL